MSELVESGPSDAIRPRMFKMDRRTQGREIRKLVAALPWRESGNSFSHRRVVVWFVQSSQPPDPAKAVPRQERKEVCMELSVRRFDEPDEERSMTLGRFELVRLGGTTVGRASYQPGWKWSEHVGPGLGQTTCPVEHVGLVVSGRNRVTMDDGTVIDIGPGDLFSIPAGHDSEVIGDEPYVSIHIMGSDSYAR